MSDKIEGNNMKKIIFVFSFLAVLGFIAVSGDIAIWGVKMIHGEKISNMWKKFFVRILECSLN